jgi:hypothetical protein
MIGNAIASPVNFSTVKLKHLIPRRPVIKVLNSQTLFTVKYRAPLRLARYFTVNSSPSSYNLIILCLFTVLPICWANIILNIYNFRKLFKRTEPVVLTTNLIFENRPRSVIQYYSNQYHKFPFQKLARLPPPRS